MKFRSIAILILLISCNIQDSDITIINLFDHHTRGTNNKVYGLDPSTGWFPYEVGNYWINENYIPCNDKTTEWYWEVIELVKTDTTNYFLLEKHINPCDTTDYTYYRDWYAYTNDDKLYLSDSNFQYLKMEADFLLNLNESYIAQGLRYTVIEKTGTWMVFEYDLYFDGTYTRRWIKGLGRELHWNKVKISEIEYQQDIDY